MPKKILIVDDEPQILRLLQLRLQANNYEVIASNNGREALNIARAANPDLIMTDIMLPEMNGLALCRMLKFDKKYKNIPVIILSGRVQAADYEAGSQVGADAYISKPFEPQTLLAKIAELIKAKGDAS